MQVKINLNDLVISDQELITLVNQRLKFSDIDDIEDGKIIEEIENYYTDKVYRKVVGDATEEQVANFKKQERAYELIRELKDLLEV